MKLSVAIAGENALPSAFVVWRGFQDSMRKAAEYGYHGVELALKTAADVSRDKLADWLARYSLEVSCISTGQVFADLGLYFTHPDREIRDRVVEVFAGFIELAQDFGGVVNIGRVRGFIGPGQSPEQVERLFLETAGRVCGQALHKKVTIILEPVNRYEINFINNLDEGSRLLSKLHYPNVGLMPDVFHMNMEDDHIGASLKRNGAMIKYIHLADSNRLAPGQGHLDFAEVFTALGETGYDGWAAVEILAKPDPDLAARQAAEYLLPRIKQYNLQQLGKI
ncbi:MAG: sugar phosphate isomerase/epimerase [Paenibacillaceae bacterium]|nr:sugar phosphate isomerase/epimerase [Paenibacillaceae bacterium]